MKINQILILAIIFTLLFSACGKKGGSLLPNSTGMAYELLVIMNKPQWEGPAGRALFAVLDSDVPGLPQSEPEFKLSYATPDRLGSLLKPVRNIIIATIDPQQYTQARMKASKEVWAQDQLILNINAPDEASFAAYVEENKSKIINTFVQHEISRSKEVIESKYNRDVTRELQDYLGVNVKIPLDLKTTKTGQDFFWVTLMKTDDYKSIVVYTYPYTDTNTFTVDYVLHKRDSVMKANIPGGPEGSYMATQYIFPADSAVLNVNGRYTLEVRSLWHIEGDNMGGPFVSHTVLDEVNNRVITAEAFVYRPGKEKRNAMRILEASLYTLLLNGAQGGIQGE